MEADIYLEIFFSGEVHNSEEQTTKTYTFKRMFYLFIFYGIAVGA